MISDTRKQYQIAYQFTAELKSQCLEQICIIYSDPDKEDWMAAAGVHEWVKIQETILEQYLILILLYAVSLSRIFSPTKFPDLLL